MKFGEVVVSKTNCNFHLIEWELVSDPFTGDLVDDYKFFVWHSEDPETGYAKLVEDGVPVEISGTTGPLSYTHQNRQYNFDRERYYKVEMVKVLDLDSSAFSKIVYIGDRSSGYHQTMKYAEDMLYAHYSGEPSVIIKKKGSGSRCPECWSSERQQKIKSFCDTCDGTGFIQGYFSPIASRISFDSNPKISIPGKTGEKITDTIMARMSNYPLVKPKDLVINSDENKRYVIEKIENTKLPNISSNKNSKSRSNYTVSQILTLVEITSSDQEYFINIENLSATTENIYSDEDSCYSTGSGCVIKTKDPLRVINGILELNYEVSHFELDGFGTFRIKQSILDSIGDGNIDGGSSETTYTSEQDIDGGGADG